MVYFNVEVNSIRTRIRVREVTFDVDNPTTGVIYPFANTHEELTDNGEKIYCQVHYSVEFVNSCDMKRKWLNEEDSKKNNNKKMKN